VQSIGFLKRNMKIYDFIAFLNLIINKSGRVEFLTIICFYYNNSKIDIPQDIREWDGMAQNFIKKLIDSMPKRVAKVVEVNGNAIRY
jgi:hypothetical protein